MEKLVTRRVGAKVDTFPIPYRARLLMKILRRGPNQLLVALQPRRHWHFHGPFGSFTSGLVSEGDSFQFGVGG